ncbi:MAG: hypothetical protein HYW47_02370 [Deltaproteobacteria bacterium]|nr:hypothetical protein [Deltaproteobacteria bacterium]
MKTFILIIFLNIAVFGCTQKNKTETTALPSQLTTQTESQEGEKAPYEIKGETVSVNNQYCAVSHSKMEKEDLGKWTNTVEYKGDNPQFKGKKLVFNQCCGGCIQRFPQMWSDEQDQIMQFHGLE